MGKNQKDRGSHIKTHKISYIIVVGLALIAAGLLLYTWWDDWQEQREDAAYQQGLAPFYDPPSPLPNTSAGHLIRSEKMNIDVPEGGSAYRILYVSQRPDNTPVAVSGMVFVPKGDAPDGGRKVIAWAHGTLGFGNSCTPSRSLKAPLNDTQNWLGGALQRGYVVAATDYAGVGTPGDRYYLVGKSEAYDVLNSVRAARALAVAKAGSEFVTWGHSQGGHSSLFAAQYAPAYAPELKLAGVAAAAPAAELGPLFSQQYQTIAWGIGPDVAVSWPNVYPDLAFEDLLTEDAKRNYKKMASGCLQQEIAGLAIRQALNSQFFKSNPLDDPAWARAATAETPDPKQIHAPVYITQGLEDSVILPNTTALLVQKACAANGAVKLEWLGKTNHPEVAMVAGPNVMAWIQDRFAGQAAPSDCGQPLPVAPAQ